MSIKIGEVYGTIAEKMMESQFPHVISENQDLFWKLCIAKLIAGPRCNIPLKNGLELYVYDQLLPGLSSWKDYYFFLMKMKQEYEK